MTSKRQSHPTHLIRTILIVLCLIGMVFVQAVGFSFASELRETLINDTLTRLLGGLAFFLILWSIGYSFLKPLRQPFVTILLITLPGWIVAINNLPIVAYLSDRATVTENGITVLLFFLNTLSVGLFEEIVFRGVILVVLLQRLPRTKNGTILAVVLSAAIFGLVHLFNLVAGASLGDTLLQVGYSFLMGLLWAVVFLATRSIWSAIGLHALYNFTGMLFVSVGVMYDRYDPVTIVLTVLIGIAAGLYYLRVLMQLNQTMLEELITPS